MLAFAWPLFATYNLVVSGADEEEPGRKKPEYSAVALFLCVTSGIWAAAWAATLWLLWPHASFVIPPGAWECGPARKGRFIGIDCDGSRGARAAVCRRYLLPRWGDGK